MASDKRRVQLEEAALSILTRQGARALTIKEIAAAVGITGGAVFRHFKDKEALIDAAVTRFEGYLTALPDGELPAVERLGRFFRERVTAVRERPEILGLAFNDRLQEVVGERGAARVRARMRESVAFVRQCVSDAQADGALADTLDPDVIGWMITGAMRGAARSDTDVDAVWEQVRLALFSRPRRRGTR